MQQDNAEVITLLKRLAQIADLRGDTHREKAYRGAILGLQSINWSIKNNPNRLEEEKIAGVGKAIKNKLLEYVQTGKIDELARLENSKDVLAYQELSKIAGAGPKIVAEWIGKGIYTLADLRQQLAKGKIELTNVQKYGLTYYHDLNSRIPRAEVELIGNSVIQKIRELDPGSLCEITGSYRRKLESSGDIDIITSGEYSLRELNEKYEKDPFYIGYFAVGVERLTFIYKSPTSGIVRQIDVLRLPIGQYWSGILYFTGSWEFNAAMRGYAKSKGFLLNQRGLFRIKGGVEILIKVTSERQIFDTIGIKYVEPQYRIDVSNITPL